MDQLARVIVRGGALSRKRLACGALAILALWLVSVPVCADESLERYFDQLRRRGLFSVAETYAFTRLADPKLDPRRRTELVVELSRTYAEHAAFAGPPQQDEFWKKSRDILQDELDRKPASPRSALLRAQQAFVSAVQSDVLYRDAQVQPDDGALHATALRAAAAAVDALKQLVQQNQEALRPTPNRIPKSSASSEVSPASDDLSPFERRSLIQTALLEMGYVLLHRAELRIDAKDRAADVVEAQEAFRQSQQGAAEPRRVARAKLGLAECLRLQKDYGRVREQLTSLAGTDPPLPVDLLDAIDACRVRTWLDEGKPVEAMEFLLGIRHARPQMSGELWFLQLQAVLQLRATAEQKQDQKLAEQLRSEAELVLARVDEHAGGWWSRYCRLLWAREQTREQYGADLDQLVRRARGEYNAGLKDAAATTFGVAVKLAWEKQQTELAVDAGFTRGSILLELQQFDAAAQELSQLVERAPQHSRTPAAHLLAAYSLGRLYDAQKTKSRREAYTAALQAHIQRFPDDLTTGDARFMLGRLEEQRLQATQALPLYLAILVDHPRGIEATASAARCYQTIITRLKQQDREWQPLQREACDTIAARLHNLSADAATWSIHQVESVLGLVRLSLLSSPPDYRFTDRYLELLQRALASHRSTDDTGWKTLSQQTLPLRLLALAGTGRSEMARTLLTQLPGDDPQRLWAVVRGLDQLSTGDPAGSIVELTELCVAAVARLEPLRDRLSPTEQLDFDLARVRAYVLTGRVEPGLPVAQQLATASAKDKERQLALATVLQQSSSVEAQKLARTCWRRVENMSPPGSMEWFQARLEIIRGTLTLGERHDAAKLFKVTQLLYPLPDSESIRERMAALEKDLSAPPK
jgi:tetratricopeptide (TPR) repeat protein